MVIRPLDVAAFDCVDIDSAPIKRTQDLAIRDIPMDRGARPAHQEPDNYAL